MSFSSWFSSVHTQKSINILYIFRDLSDNNITYIEPLSFTQLNNLQTLKLADNELIFFPKLPNMTDLVTLDLSNNLIRSFEIEAFTDFAGNDVFKTL